MAKQSLSEVVGVRLTPHDLRKLNKLAQVTFRRRGDVLRCLIRQAQVAEHLDLFIGSVNEKDVIDQTNTVALRQIGATVEEAIHVD
jgi:hypothetical protein